MTETATFPCQQHLCHPLLPLLLEQWVVLVWANRACAEWQRAVFFDLADMLTFIGSFDIDLKGREWSGTGSRMRRNTRKQTSVHRGISPFFVTEHRCHLLTGNPSAQIPGRMDNHAEIRLSTPSIKFG